ncbi:MAG: hypothetical protein LUD72_05900, partial [Bacteroidales bacterium]|nr:hypothetical protein [Bacteroidales bacterium]
SRDKVMTSPPPDAPYAKTIQKIIDLDLEVNADVDRYVDLKHEIIDRIQKMEDLRFVNLLYKRYVEYKPFDMIAREMGYVYRYTVQLHGEALSAFEETYSVL